MIQKSLTYYIQFLNKGCTTDPSFYLFKCQDSWFWFWILNICEFESLQELKLRRIKTLVLENQFLFDIGLLKIRVDDVSYRHWWRMLRIISKCHFQYSLITERFISFQHIVMASVLTNIELQIFHMFII